MAAKAAVLVLIDCDTCRAHCHHHVGSQIQTPCMCLVDSLRASCFIGAMSMPSAVCMPTFQRGESPLSIRQAWSLEF